MADLLVIRNEINSTVTMSLENIYKICDKGPCVVHDAVLGGPIKLHNAFDGNGTHANT